MSLWVLIRQQEPRTSFASHTVFLETDWVPASACIVCDFEGMALAPSYLQTRPHNQFVSVEID